MGVPGPAALGRVALRRNSGAPGAGRFSTACFGKGLPAGCPCAVRVEIDSLGQYDRRKRFRCRSLRHGMCLGRGRPRGLRGVRMRGTEQYEIPENTIEKEGNSFGAHAQYLGDVFYAWPLRRISFIFQLRQRLLVASFGANCTITKQTEAKLIQAKCRQYMFHHLTARSVPCLAWVNLCVNFPCVFFLLMS